MYGLLIGVYFICERFLFTFFGESDFVVNRIIRYFYCITSLVLESLMFAVELHLITIPRIAIRTHQVVTVACTRIAEFKLGVTYTIQMTHSYSNPGG